MDNSKKSRSTASNEAANIHPHVRRAASELLNEGKKVAQEFLAEGTQKLHETQDSAKEYSDLFVNKVRENPLTSVLVAGGVGFILSALFRKK